jgi:hypothetical protein
MLKRLSKLSSVKIIDEHLNCSSVNHQKRKNKLPRKRWVFEIVPMPGTLSQNSGFSWKNRYANEKSARQAYEQWKANSGGMASIWPPERWLGKVFED